jgi:hypothetical protein
MDMPKPLTQSEIETMGTNLIADINEAFTFVSIDNGVTLSEADAIDDHYGPKKRAKARAKDTYKHWNEINLPAKDPGDSALSFVDPIGFRFHLPAYMSYIIRQQLHDLQFQFHAVYYDLTLRLEIGSEYGKLQTSLLQHEERRCVAKFLIFSCESDYTGNAAVHPEEPFSLEDYYGYGDSLRVMRIYWWNNLNASEQKLLLQRWPILEAEPY